MVEIHKEHFSVTPATLVKATWSHSSLIDYYGSELPKEQKRLNCAELELGIYDAELELKIKNNAKTSNEKLTEATVKAMIATDEKHIELVRKTFDIQENVESLKQCINALKAKGDEIDKLIALSKDKSFATCLVDVGCKPIDTEELVRQAHMKAAASNSVEDSL